MACKSKRAKQRQRVHRTRHIEARNADHAKANKLVADIRGHWSRHTELVVLQQGEARMLKEFEMLTVPF